MNDESEKPVKESKERAPADSVQSGEPIYYVQLPGGFVATGPSSYPPPDFIENGYR